ncbi:alpha-L-rhamnosidase N-terminal domain-containing protein [Chitinophaga arvensicola]|uniref:Alpha-L-rhamnosidase N-terminal domain-containing protein n=1 Tax=Chitinophaga arvensicola TaxID=29529 RepID=A0A1I0QF75_9BACT|nr:alpha-L-rhamnosidase N-terminal domain-containing protein [Chitinophaga arvensicola]SEW25556.1 Alpha-L-rhamnosidase N-terminal domain-containing protein [Chitinophaga arvensicola]
MKYLLQCLLLPALLGFTLMGAAQDAPAHNPAQWDARWIADQNAVPAAYGVYLFRKEFQLLNYSGPFIIHLSADNHYRLYVNGQFAGTGPARSDPANWYYETIDIGPQLKYGANVIAVEVTNAGPYKPRGQFSQGTALLIQGHSSREAAIINTGSTSWRVLEDESVHPLPVKSTSFYGAAPGDSVMAQYHPWGWEQPAYKDSAWATAVVVSQPLLQGRSANGWRLLTPSPLGGLQQERQSFHSLVTTQGITPEATWLKGTAPLTIPAKRKVHLVLDAGQQTTGFPEMLISGGLDAGIKISYQPAYTSSTIVQDVIRPDGGLRRKFRSGGYRSFRYVQLDIETGKAPLVLHDYYNVYTQYGLQDKSSFTATPATDSLWAAGKRAALTGAQDNLYNDPFQEQLQYIQDARIQGLALTYFSGDDHLLRNALVQTDQSRIPEGLMRSRYPSDDRMVSVTDALSWIGAVQDYLLYKADKSLAKQFYPGIRSILDWVDRYQDPATGLPGSMPYSDSTALSPITGEYLYALRQAALIAGYCDKSADSLIYARTADKLREVWYQQCYDAAKGLYAETPARKSFSRYTNAMAVLAQAVPPRQVKNVMQRLVSEKAPPYESLRAKYYIFKAMQETGVTETFPAELKVLTSLLEQNQTAAYQSSAAVANLFLLGITAGIQSTSYGFKTVLIAPDPGAAPTVNAVMVHPDGELIVVRLVFKNNRVSGTVRLPFGVTGKFRWRGREITLHGGPQEVSL